MRDRPDIAEERLRTCLRDVFGRPVSALEFLPLGKDANSALYRATSEQGPVYALKARRGPRYEATYRTPRALSDQGVAAVVAPLPARDGALWADLDGWSVALYPFIEGGAGWLPAMTSEQWRATGVAIAQVHRGVPPTGGGAPRREAFDAPMYLRQAREIEARAADGPHVTPQQRALSAIWTARRPMIHRGLNALMTLAGALRQVSWTAMICHADLHPGNILRGLDGAVHLLDWDDVMLAPKERDFLFIDNMSMESAARPDGSPFFQGYREVAGAVEINWVALTYYLWERAITDLIECSRWVYERDDLSAEARDSAVALFDSLFSPGDEVENALTVATHLSPSLRERLMVDFPRG